MHVGAPFPLLLLLVIALVIVIIIASSAGRRRQLPWLPERRCDGCGAGNPLHANYCRRCGRKVG